MRAGSAPVPRVQQTRRPPRHPRTVRRHPCDYRCYRQRFLDENGESCRVSVLRLWSRLSCANQVHRPPATSPCPRAQWQPGETVAHFHVSLPAPPCILLACGPDWPDSRGCGVPRKWALLASVTIGVLYPHLTSCFGRFNICAMSSPSFSPACRNHGDEPRD